MTNTATTQSLSAMDYLKGLHFDPNVFTFSAIPTPETIKNMEVVPPCAVIISGDMLRALYCRTEVLVTVRTDDPRVKLRAFQGKYRREYIVYVNDRPMLVFHKWQAIKRD